MMSIDSDLTLPYWDAANDFDAPHEAEVFSSHAFGGNGSPDDNYCLTDGFMAGLKVNYPWTRCVKRDFQGPHPDTIHSWHSPVFITSLIQTSSNYDEFRQTLEHSLHNAIHFSIGGFNGDFSRSHHQLTLFFSCTTPILIVSMLSGNFPTLII
ncbi:uncharacterized protein LOC107363460 [Tetranychus urticae]|uniref:uncharacterized protein LOC107363460 n=1 Tax=Tetranychus urticae TaxID=32264 RepID=UPI00077BE18B|nr:uncharacterized protein LOC107363460 [Tetranychus urticae]